MGTGDWFLVVLWAMLVLSFMAAVGEFLGVFA